MVSGARSCTSVGNCRPVEGKLEYLNCGVEVCEVSADIYVLEVVTSSRLDVCASFDTTPDVGTGDSPIACMVG